MTISNNNQALPNFVEGPANVVKRLPYVGYGATLQAFLFKGNSKSLQSICDQMLNVPSGGAVKFRVVTSYVLFTTLYQPRVQSDDPTDKSTGYVTEIDAALWVLALDSMGKGGLCWFPVWLFVDTGSAIAAGREVFGYPKQQASFDRAISAPPGDAAVTINTLAFVGSGPNEPAVMLDLLALKPATAATQTDIDQTTPASYELGLTKFRNIIEQDKDTIGPTGVTNSLFPPFLGMPMVFLKQFRDIAQVGKACYQAVTTVTVESTKISDFAFFPTGYELMIKRAASHPIAEDLGISSGQKAAFSFWLVQDFYVGFGQILWQAQID